LALVALTAAGLNLVGNAALVALIPALTLACAIGRAPGALAAGVIVFVLSLPFVEDGASAFGGRGPDGILELEFIFMALTITPLVLASAFDARDDAHARLRERAPTDRLTRLPNRLALEEHLERVPPDADVGLVLVT